MSLASFLTKTVATLITPVVAVEKGVNRVKESVKEDIEDILVRMLTLIFLSFLTFMLLLFVSITVALFLNKQFSSNYQGYVVVAAFYFILVSAVLLLQFFDVDLFRGQAKKILKSRQSS